MIAYKMTVNYAEPKPFTHTQQTPTKTIISESTKYASNVGCLKIGTIFVRLNFAKY